MTTIHLHLPDDLANKVQSLTGNAEKFILDLLRSKVNELGTPTTLADEYRLAGAENSKLMADFGHADLEGWDDEY